MMSCGFSMALHMDFNGMWNDLLQCFNGISYDFLRGFNESSTGNPTEEMQAEQFVLEIHLEGCANTTKDLPERRAKTANFVM